MDQITRLCDEWYTALTGHIHNNDNNNNDDDDHSKNYRTPLSSLSSSSAFSRGQYHYQQEPQQQQQRTRLPRFLLISLGPSYGQSRELYLFDFQSLIDDDDDDDDVNNRSNNDPNNNADTTPIMTREKEQKLEAMLTRKLVSALMNNHGGGGDQSYSMTNSLPPTTSPSFRLWFTAGFEITKTTSNTEISPMDVDDDDSATTDNNDEGGRTPSPIHEDNSAAAAAHAAIASPFSSTSWIPRTKFPMSIRQSQSRPSSRKQSLVTLRFHRSRRQQQQQQQQHHPNQNEAKDAPITIDPSSLHPTSEQLTWMSLSTCVKGFRL